MLLNILISALVALGVSLGGGPVSSALYGASVFIVQQGGTGGSTFTSGELLYGSGTNPLQTVGTTTAECTGNTSCDPFVVIGDSPITINTSGGSGGGLASSTVGSGWTPGNVAVVRDNGSVYGAATSSATINGPLSGSLITLGSGSLSISQANSSTDGYLSSTDWTIFNNKVSSTSLSGTAPITYNSSTGAIGCNVASGSQAGCLSSTDWGTFNNKISSTSLSAGAGISYNSTTGVIANTIGYPFPSNATSTLINFGGGLASASTTLTGPFIFANATGTNATTTNLSVSGAVDFDLLTSAILLTGSTGILSEYGGSSCAAGQFTNTISALGVVGCAAGAAYPFTPGTFGSTLTSATSTTINGTNGFVSTASSTLQRLQVEHGTTTNATSTNLSVSGPVDFDQYTSALIITGSTGILAEYTGTSCSAGQFANTLSALGVATCAAAAPYPFTPTNNFNTVTSATSTTMLLTAGLHASSTVRFGDAGVPHQFTWNSANGKLGIGTSTPASLLSINPINIGAVPSFLIGSSTGGQPQFQITHGGQAGVCESKAGFGPTSATSTTYTINWVSTCPSFTYNTGTSATTISLINATTSNMVGSRKIVTLCNPGSTGGAITWKGVQWIGTAPTQTTTANKCDVYSFFVTSATSTVAAPSYIVAGAASTGL